MEYAYTGSTHELTPEAVGDELRRIKDAIKKLEARESGLQMQAESMLRGGKHVKGWVLTASYAREGYVEGGEQAIITLGHLMGVNVAKPMRAITPNQARKLLPTNLVNMYAHKPSTGVRLTKQDPYEARKAFDNK